MKSFSKKMIALNLVLLSVLITPGGVYAGDTLNSQTNPAEKPTATVSAAAPAAQQTPANPLLKPPVMADSLEFINSSSISPVAIKSNAEKAPGTDSVLTKQPELYVACDKFQSGKVGNCKLIPKESFTQTLKIAQERDKYASDPTRAQDSGGFTTVGTGSIIDPAATKNIPEAGGYQFKSQVRTFGLPLYSQEADPRLYTIYGADGSTPSSPNSPTSVVSPKPVEPPATNLDQELAAKSVCYAVGGNSLAGEVRTAPKCPGPSLNNLTSIELRKTYAARIAADYHINVDPARITGHQYSCLPEYRDCPYFVWVTKESPNSTEKVPGTNPIMPAPIPPSPRTPEQLPAPETKTSTCYAMGGLSENLTSFQCSAPSKDNMDNLTICHKDDGCHQKLVGFARRIGKDANDFIAFEPAPPYTNDYQEKIWVKSIETMPDAGQKILQWQPEPVVGPCVFGIDSACNSLEGGGPLWRRYANDPQLQIQLAALIKDRLPLFYREFLHGDENNPTTLAKTFSALLAALQHAQGKHPGEFPELTPYLQVAGTGQVEALKAEVEAAQAELDRASAADTKAQEQKKLAEKTLADNQLTAANASKAAAAATKAATKAKNDSATAAKAAMKAANDSAIAKKALSEALKAVVQAERAVRAAAKKRPADKTAAIKLLNIKKSAAAKASKTAAAAEQAAAKASKTAAAAAQAAAKASKTPVAAEQAATKAAAIVAESKQKALNAAKAAVTSAQAKVDAGKILAAKKAALLAAAAPVPPKVPGVSVLTPQPAPPVNPETPTIKTVKGIFKNYGTPTLSEHSQNQSDLKLEFEVSVRINLKNFPGATVKVLIGPDQNHPVETFNLRSSYPNDQPDFYNGSVNGFSYNQLQSGELKVWVQVLGANGSILTSQQLNSPFIMGWYGE